MRRLFVLAAIEKIYEKEKSSSAQNAARPEIAGKKFAGVPNGFKR